MAREKGEGMTQQERFERLLAKHPDADEELKCLLALTVLTKEQMELASRYIEALRSEVAGREAKP